MELGLIAGVGIAFLALSPVAALKPRRPHSFGVAVTTLLLHGLDAYEARLSASNAN